MTQKILLVGPETQTDLWDAHLDGAYECHAVSSAQAAIQFLQEQSGNGAAPYEMMVAESIAQDTKRTTNINGSELIRQLRDQQIAVGQTYLFTVNPQLYTDPADLPRGTRVVRPGEFSGENSLLNQMHPARIGAAGNEIAQIR